MSWHRGWRGLGLVGLALAAGLLCALVARGASTVIVLNLEAGYSNRALKACSIVHHYTFFKRARLIRMNGVVSPAPTATGWKIKVKVKRCSAGRFRTVWTGHAVGHKAGRYDIAYRPRRRGYYFARAYYYGVTPAAESDKEYFRVA